MHRQLLPLVVEPAEAEGLTFAAVEKGCSFGVDHSLNHGMQCCNLKSLESFYRRILNIAGLFW